MAINGKNDFDNRVQKYFGTLVNGKKLPTIAGLTLALGFSDKKEMEDWSKVQEWRTKSLSHAMTVIEKCICDRLLNPENKTWKAAWSYLAHHFKYNDRPAQEIKEQDDKVRFIALPIKKDVGAPVQIPHKVVETVKTKVEKPVKEKKEKLKPGPKPKEERKPKPPIKPPPPENPKRPWFRSKWNDAEEELATKRFVR